MKLCEVKQLLEVVESAATIAAIVVAGVWTYILFVKKRQKYPRAHVTHQVSHMTISKAKVLLRVTVTIENRGEVLLSLISGFIRIQQMVPWPTELTGEGGGQISPVDNDKPEVDWPILKETSMPFGGVAHEIEPNEVDQVHFDFLLDANVQTVLVYSYIRNASKRFRFSKRLRSEIGWNTKTLYHLQEEDNMKAGKEGVEKQGPPQERPPVPRPQGPPQSSPPKPEPPKPK